MMERYDNSTKSYSLEFFTEYYQFYLQDKNTKARTDSDTFWTTQAFEDRMAVEEGLLGISVAKYATIKLQVNFHPLKENTLSLAAYDHVVEASINAPSGILQILNCTSMVVQLEINVPHGSYTVRSSSACLQTVKADTGNDFYVIDIYPAEKTERTVLKKYATLER
jgi:hypothetical protein